MSAAVALPSAQEYLAADRAHERKLEFWYGTLIEVAGASIQHNTIAANALVLLHARARKRGCRAYGSDQRVALPLSNYAYPEVSVACAPETNDDRPESLLNPLLVVEVTSRSTERYDREDKLMTYTQLGSLEAYWIVSQDLPAVSLYERRAGTWTYRGVGGLGGVIDSPLFGQPIRMGDLYDGVDLFDPFGQPPGGAQ